MARFRLAHDSLQDRFLHSKAKIQIYAGGFANGKTSAIVIRALQLAKDYPGSNGLLARSTYPKLNDTLRKEFIKWCPNDWIKSFPKSQNSSNTCTLNNGTEVNFRYIAQQGKNSKDATTSNLLSATYDWIGVDQAEDPEIVHKDFLDLLGRLRGMAIYRGDDNGMPRTGPRWIMVTLNPTRNWAYRELVKPLHDFNRGFYNPRLLCDTDSEGKPIVDEEGTPKPILELFEGSTYENEDNLEPDFIRTLEATYKGQMRDRFLLGKWSAYEGLVYPQFDEAVHVASHQLVEQHYRKLCISNDVQFLEGYDFGIAVASCYILGFVDTGGNVFLMDGFHRAEYSIDDQLDEINRIRKHYAIPSDNHIFADPDIFRRKKMVVGDTIADKFLAAGVYCTRGNADIRNGIIKVSQYLIPQEKHRDPLTGDYNAPYLYVSNKLDFAINEFNEYYWKKDTTGDQVDKPVAKADHAMDTVKYLLSRRPNIATLIPPVEKKAPGWYRWGDRDISERMKSARYG